jgi:endogenous inhibitor of DNA gyrase (YacG/DUF329 family)
MHEEQMEARIDRRKMLSVTGVWNCARCGQERRATAHQRTKRFCSNTCHSLHRSDIGDYKAYNPPAAHNCKQCGAEFTAYRSSKRMFCSYACHLASGGALRAGFAAAKATMRYGAKKDANHVEIMSVIRNGCAAWDLSNAGCGVPDGVAWVSKAWRLFDIKNPKTGYGKRGLNKVQKKWISQYQGGPVYLIYTTEEAKRFAAGELAGLKWEGNTSDNEVVFEIDSPERAMEVIEQLSGGFSKAKETPSPRS